MLQKLPSRITVLLCLYFFNQSLAAQNLTTAALFQSDAVLPIKLSGNVRDLFNDRGDDAKYHPLVLSYKKNDSSNVSLTLNAQTRGHFRKELANCTIPPVLLNFEKSERAATLFEDQNKLKLVTACRGEKYVIREYLVYRLYNLLTPKSFRARLVQTTFDDTIRKKEISFYGILLEEAPQMAKRNGVRVSKQKRMPTQR